jgi:hypothetical protein
VLLAVDEFCALGEYGNCMQARGNKKAFSREKVSNTLTFHYMRGLGCYDCYLDGFVFTDEYLL